jgi:hypothetical protein
LIYRDGWAISSIIITAFGVMGSGIRRDDEGFALG